MKKKRNSLIHNKSVWAGLLLSGSLAFGISAADDANQSYALRFEGGSLSLTAQDAQLADVITAIVESTELRLVQHVSLDRRISMTLDRQRLPDALDQLLSEESYQLYQQSDDYDGAVPGTLWIFSAGESLAPAATVFFEAVLYRGTRREKKEAIRELRRLGTGAAVQALSLAVMDDDAIVRKNAFAALEFIASDEALAAIASAALQGDPAVRERAVSALASGDTATSAQYLTLALNDPDPRVRMSVVEALADVPFGSVPGEQTIDALGRALKDESPDVRMAAIDALEEIGGEVAFKTLLLAGQDKDPEILEAMNESLRWIGAEPQ